MTKKYICEVFIGGLIYVVLCFRLSRRKKIIREGEAQA